jgi:hypothetical protein
VWRDATVDWRHIALALDRARALLYPTLELLAASSAIHRAPILLSDWCDLTGPDRSVEV